MSQVPTETTEVPDDIGFLFEDFLAAVHQLENALTGARLIFADCDLSIGDWVVLRNVPAYEDVPIGLLARRTGLSRQRLNKLLEHLQDSGLVQIRKQSQDKRVRLVKITGSGTRELAAISKAMRGIADATVGNTKPEMLQRLVAIAKRIVNAMAPRLQKSTDEELSASAEEPPVGDEERSQGQPELA
jgi:DNA-binding MarR family transcriptional regulator